ncbi:MULTISPECIES: hypothetical protein [unclassified Pseudoalteromonas]|jgi:hypothetical protein|uniref:hypothetical protein n=1 Tax=unclassified Pseudoalteromonas TaxID=194690 RepID=UPI0015FAD11C|nr:MULTISPECIES: hypothetical protein [unclassified Pseudoalteromonas]MBB1299568.1 hypothetical protein [Pseudoalteromonas sp. SR41-7]MBB1352803.1 hypothetical protein [Pseudoalteromonas sp. SR45-5]MBB1444322.1 hypothetical protein [Pseudoalteromonas sp. SG43-3]
MYFLKKLKWLMLACILTSMSAQVSAHVLKNTTAQVILRDGQVEVKVLTNAEHLISALQSEQAWLMGDIDKLMPTNLSAEQQEEFAKNALKQKTSLRVNQQVIVFERVTFTTSNNNEAHDLEIVFQAKHTFTTVDELAISFPKSLGAVHASFVKPQYKLLGAGDTAKIKF